MQKTNDIVRNSFFVLGAKDMEMDLIERLLTAASEKGLIAGFGYAAVSQQRCHPGNAYKATDVMAIAGKFEGAEVVVVECDFTVTADKTVIDHHQRGDFGFGKPASESVAASSLGQVLSLFGSVPTREFTEPLSDVLHSLGLEHLGGTCDPGCEFHNPPAPGGFVFDHGWWLGIGEHSIGQGTMADFAYILPTPWVAAMAADHNLTAAYKGEVQGIAAEDVLAVRLPEVAQRNRVTENIARDEITKAAGLLAESPRVKIGDIRVFDIRDAGVQPFALEAATMNGDAFIGRVDSRDASKVMCSAPTEAVKAFLNGWAAEQGITSTYGDPARGFAGGTQN